MLKHLKDSQINLICKQHNIDRKLSRELKITSIINEGVSFQDVLLEEIYKEGMKASDKKSVFNNFIDKDLKITESIKGSTLEQKVESLILHYQKEEEDNKMSISMAGYNKLLADLDQFSKTFNRAVKSEFEIQNEYVMNGELLLDYNIFPLDILYLLKDDELKKFCEKTGIKTRGDILQNIVSNYQNVDDLLLENYDLVATRDYNSLKQNGINIKESELGIKFEELTSMILSKLNLNVSVQLRKKVSTKKDKVDILVDLGNDEVLIVECKTTKDREFKKYSSVSRQVKSYKKLLESSGYRVARCLLVSSDFTDDFVSECEFDIEGTLSLIKATSLVEIMNSFELSKHESFPVQLLMRDVLIDSKRISKALLK